MRALLTLSAAATLGALTACNGTISDTSGGDDEESCDCVDATEYLDITGYWTMTIGENYSDDDYGCNVSSDVEDWLQGALEIKGRLPNDLYVYINNEDTPYPGKMTLDGGVVFAGVREEGGQELHFSFGGLAWEDAYLGRVVMKGFAYGAVDSLGDGELDCGIRADMSGFRSGR